MSSTVTAAPRRGRRSIHRLITILPAAIAVAGTIACGGSDKGTGPTTQDQVGIYGLMHVDKKAIPTDVFNGPFYDADYGGTYPLVIRVTGGEVVLQEDGGFHLAIDRSWSSEGDGGTGTLTIEGTYEIQGTQIAIDTDSGSGTGSFQNGEITLSLDVGETGKMRKYLFRRAR